MFNAFLKRKSCRRSAFMALCLSACLLFMTACGQPTRQMPATPDVNAAPTEGMHPKMIKLDPYVAGYVGADAIEAGKSDIDFASYVPPHYETKLKLKEHGHPFELYEDGSFFIFYYQDKEGGEWNDLPHGKSTVAQSGCGTVCLSMALTALTGDIEKYTPAKIVECELEDHIATPNRSVNSIPVINRCIGSPCKVKYYEGDLSFKVVDETLKKGGYVILDQRAKTSGESRKLFGNKNHYIMIRGGNKEDGYLIANPLYGYSRPDSPAQYAPQNKNVIPAKMFHAMYWYTVTN